MTETLSRQDLILLVQRVFAPGSEDRALAIIADIPDERLPDNPQWQARREMAHRWAELLADARSELGLERTSLAWYRNCGSNNADLPETFVYGTGDTIPDHADQLERSTSVPFAELFRTNSIIMAPTELSATAPLKVAVREHPFRAATMPGFGSDMIPALKIDYVEVNRRVLRLKELCDRAEQAEVVLAVPGDRHELLLDLRHRLAHASGGLFPQNGVAGNLPSGEAYIVPYEGEIAGDPSRSAGKLPVQIGEEIVVFEIENNRAVAVLSAGEQSDREREHLASEPAYGNMAELGLGVLTDFGLEPVGSILLDEKLGLHIAFGRSDHFGGIVGPSDFSSPAAVIHLDRVYIPETQPDVTVERVVLDGPDGRIDLMQDGSYCTVF